MDLNQTLLKLVFSVIVGALIGLEREKNKQNQSQNNGVGIRTDILISLFGATSIILSEKLSPLIFYFSFCSILLIGGISYTANKMRNEVQNLKTVLSSTLVFLLGALTMLGELQIAVVIAIVVTFVLSMRYVLHSSIEKISYREIIDGITFLIIAFVVLPFLPNQNFDHEIMNFIAPPGIYQTTTIPSTNSPEINQISKPELSTPVQLTENNIINPYRIWLLIVIISGLDFLGYILVKIFGKNKGYGLSGLVGGFYSSTITAITLSEISKKQTDTQYPFVAGILFSCATSFFKMFILLQTLNLTLFSHLSPTMLVMCGYLFISGYFFNKISSKELIKKSTKNKKQELLTVQSPLRLANAIRITLIVVTTMILANIILMYSDINYYYLLAALMAFFFTDDPIIISTAGIAGITIAYPVARAIIIGVMFLNILQKVATIYVFGNRQLVKPMAITMVGLFLVTGLSFLYL